MGIYGVLRKTKVDEDEPESVLLQKEVGGLMIISSFVYQFWMSLFNEK